MSSSFGYLIPDRPFELGKFKEAIVAAFEDSKVINGFYDEENQWYAAGESSYFIFEDKGPGYPAFEYVEIHDTVNNRVIPDCTSDNYGAKCKKCKANIDNSFIEELDVWAAKEFESGVEMDMDLLTIVCQQCNSINKMNDIEFDIDVRVKNQFVCFVEIDAEFDSYIIEEVAKVVGCKLEILYGSF